MCVPLYSLLDCLRGSTNLLSSKSLRDFGLRVYIRSWGLKVLDFGLSLGSRENAGKKLKIAIRV